MKRLVLIAALIVALLIPSEASADLDGTRLMNRLNKQCQRRADHYARRGFTERELLTLSKRNCKEVAPGVWVTSFYVAA